MGGIIVTAVSSAVAGLLVGLCAVQFSSSALRSFVLVYSAVLLAMFAIYIAQAPFVLALLGTLAFALYSFVPAVAGCVAGAALARAA